MPEGWSFSASIDSDTVYVRLEGPTKNVLGSDYKVYQEFGVRVFPIEDIIIELANRIYDRVGTAKLVSENLGIEVCCE